MTGEVHRSPAVRLTAHGLSLLGRGIAAPALPLLVLDRTGGVLAAGLPASATTTAAAATGLVSGLLVDRIDRARSRSCPMSWPLCRWRRCRWSAPSGGWI